MHVHDVVMEVLPMAETELSPCEYGEARKDDDVEDISELDDLFDDYDWCYECEGYGDDYYIDEHGEWVSACDDCPHNNAWRNDNG